MAKRVDPIREAGLLRRLNTPVGTGKYLHIESPDFEFDKNGAFKVKLFFDPNQNDVQSMMTTFDGLLEEAMEYFTSQAKNAREAKKVRPSENTPYYFEEDEDGKQTGLIYINPKMVASGTTKEGEAWTRKVPIFDAKGVRVVEKLNAGGGTTMTVALELRPYYNAQSGVGISLKLKGVQIAELKTFGGGIQTAEDAGFGEIDGGFSADTFEAPLPDAGEPDTVAEDDGSGDY